MFFRLHWILLVSMSLLQIWSIQPVWLQSYNCFTWSRANYVHQNFQFWLVWLQSYSPGAVKVTFTKMAIFNASNFSVYPSITCCVYSDPQPPWLCSYCAMSDKARSLEACLSLSRHRIKHCCSACTFLIFPT